MKRFRVVRLFANWRFGLIAAALLLPACSHNAVMSGVAVGRIGRGLSAHGASVPQGAQVCAMQEALSPPAAERSMADACAKAARSDRLWRRSMLVLTAWSEKIEALATGAKPESAGRLEAALTGVQGPDWIEADGAQEQAARDAVHQLVTQMASGTSKSDLDKSVKDAAPHVSTLCEGLGAYLEAQVKSLGDIQKEVDKKRTTRADRRCAQLDNRPLCVSESVVDRLVYAHSFGQLAAIENSHGDARDAVSAFCEAHGKLQSAAQAGQLSSDKTYGEVVEAVKRAPRTQPASPAPASSATPPAKK